MCYVETEENTETPLTVIEYISMDLKQDELQFHNPLHRKYWQKQKLICMTPTSRQSVISGSSRSYNQQTGGRYDK